MQKQQSNRRFSQSLIAGVSAAVLVAGGGTIWWAVNSITNFPKDPNTSEITLKNSPHIYWLNSTNKDGELISRPITIKKSARSSEILHSAMARLLAGPGDQNYTTTIPQGTKLLNLTVEDSEVRVNLSQEFTAGGGSASMIYRLGQILCTATSIDSNSKVWLSVEGKPLEVLGGEGVTVRQPMTRQNFEEDFAFSGCN